MPKLLASPENTAGAVIVLSWLILEFRERNSFITEGFADNIALISSTKQQTRDKTTKLEEEARRVGLKVSTEKTEVMRINVRNQDKIVVNDIYIEDVDAFTYLGAKVCKEVWCVV